MLAPLLLFTHEGRRIVCTHGRMHTRFPAASLPEAGSENFVELIAHRERPVRVLMNAMPLRTGLVTFANPVQTLQLGSRHQHACMAADNGVDSWDGLFTLHCYTNALSSLLMILA